MAFFYEGESHTFNEYLLVPGYSSADKEYDEPYAKGWSERTPWLVLKSSKQRLIK